MASSAVGKTPHAAEPSEKNPKRRTFVASPKPVDLDVSPKLVAKPKSPFWNFDVRNLATTVPVLIALVLGGNSVLVQKENAELAKRAEAAEQKAAAMQQKAAAVASTASAVVDSAKGILARNAELEREVDGLSDTLNLKMAQFDAEIASIKTRLSGKSNASGGKIPKAPEASKGKTVPELPHSERASKKSVKLKISGELTKPVASKLVESLLARVNANLPEGSALGYAASKHGTQVAYNDPSYFRRFTYERPENADKRDEKGIQAWAEAQFVRSLDCQKMKQDGVPKGKQPAYCGSAK